MENMEIKKIIEGINANKKEILSNFAKERGLPDDATTADILEVLPNEELVGEYKNKTNDKPHRKLSHENSKEDKLNDEEQINLEKLTNILNRLWLKDHTIKEMIPVIVGLLKRYPKLKRPGEVRIRQIYAETFKKFMRAIKEENEMEINTHEEKLNSLKEVFKIIWGKKFI